jgi:hypothetical protein
MKSYVGKHHVQDLRLTFEITEPSKRICSTKDGIFAAVMSFSSSTSASPRSESPVVALTLDDLLNPACRGFEDTCSKEEPQLSHFSDNRRKAVTDEILFIEGRNERDLLRAS